MRNLGIRDYRMSLEWARIEPEEGVFDTDAIAHYRYELEALVEAGIRPLVTLHHFSNPRWFAQRGEFTRHENITCFMRFVYRVVREFRNLVTDWVTINEPNVYVTQAHLFQEGPPADVSWRSVRACLRHLAQAHCRAYMLIHRLQPEAKVGFAHHMRVFVPRVASNPSHRVLTRVARYAFQDAIAQAMLVGEFPVALGTSGGVKPGRYYDFLGINYYSRSAIDKLEDGTIPGTPVNDLGWEVYSDGIVEVTRELAERYNAPVWITENGTCDNGDANADESFRCRFIWDHLNALAHSGLPVERYYHWCFTDNWEWSEGMTARFGLVSVDPATGQRTCKPSALMYRDIIREGALTPDLYDTYVAGQRYREDPQ